MALDMQVEVKDAIFEGYTDDRVLTSLIVLAMQEISTGSRLFESPLDEPILYSRHFRPWVKDALAGLKKLEERQQNDFR